MKPHLIFLFVLLTLAATIESLKLGDDKNKTIRYLLFNDPRNPEVFEELTLGDYSSLGKSKFSPSLPLVIFVHGFQEGYKSGDRIKNAYLKLDDYWPVVNMLVIDWSDYSYGEITGALQAIPEYIKAVLSVPVAGEIVTAFISWLCSISFIEPSRIHLVSFSLGCHLAGKIGSLYQLLHPGCFIERITGLDPAGPLFNFPLHLSHELTEADAKFVDVMHTNMFIAGSFEVKGHVDIYVNGGIFQPGCLNENSLYDIINCPHDFAIRVYAASFKMPFIACDCHFSIFSSSGLTTDCMHPTLVGLYTPEWTRGKLCVKVDGSIPALLY